MLTPPAADAAPIMLCLSGGGFRATFFHLGVIQALREAGRIKDVRKIFAVSGGSILAAHMAVHWEKYIGTNADFEAAKNELALFAMSDLRGRVIRRYAFTWPFQLFPKSWVPFPTTLTDHLEKQYQRLFGTAGFHQVLLDRDATPDIHLLATNLNSGELCSFSRDGYFVERDKDGLLKVSNNNTLPLAYAVAASSAFPPLFPPVMLTSERLVEPDGNMVYAHRLSDGGVFDNTAIEKALLVRGRPEENATGMRVVASDASATFNVEPRQTYTWPFGRNVRASNILMRLVARSAKAKVKDEIENGRVVLLDIRTVIKDSPHNNAVQKILGLVRTDLDWFSRNEIDALIAHGHSVGKAAFSNPTTIDPPLKLNSTANENLLAELQRSGVRRLRFFSLDDWATLPALAMVLGLPLFLAAWYYSNANEAKGANAEVELVSDRLKELATINERLASELRTRDARIRALETASTPQSVQTACRHPSHGIERYNNTATQMGQSGWRSGGYNQNRWCSDYIAQLRGAAPDARIEVVNMGEQSRSRCKPFNCPEYNYSCTVRIDTNPIYIERASSACTNQPQLRQ